MANYDYEPQYGTDFIRYHDKKTDTWYEANWNSDYRTAFGYWPADENERLQMFVADNNNTHEVVCCKAAQSYCENVYFAQVYEYNCVDTIIEKIDELISDIDEYNMHYDEDNDEYVSNDETYSFNIRDEYDSLIDDMPIPIDDFSSFFADSINNRQAPSYQEVEQIFQEFFDDSYDFSCKERAEIALQDICAISYNDFFGKGETCGAIFPSHELIGFYDGTEPRDGYEMKQVIYDLSKAAEIGLEELLNYFYVFPYDGNYEQVTRMYGARIYRW